VSAEKDCGEESLTYWEFGNPFGGCEDHFGDKSLVAKKKRRCMMERRSVFVNSLR